jgi:hypothetical protein
VAVVVIIVRVLSLQVLGAGSRRRGDERRLADDMSK